jgi:TatD DNase family protein
MLIDSHTHMNMVEIPIEKVIKKAKDAGISKILTNSTSFSSNKESIELSRKYEEIEACIGLYPMNALELNESELDNAFNFFEENYKEAIAIGEVGIDWKLSEKDSEREAQQKNFERFINFSINKDLPIVIHSRYAIKKALQIIEEKEAEKVYFHSYTDSRKLMLRAARQGFYCGCGLNIMWDELVQERIRVFPLENLLLETDSPIRYEGEKVYPDAVKMIYEKVSELKKIEFNEVEKQIEQNNKDLFGI